jgi:exportin-2 (importin alpha re-exporter)
LRTTASSLLDPANPPSSQDISVIAECMALLLAIYFDLTSQDLPPMVEDSFPEFFGIEGGDEGWFIKFLRWDPPQLRGDVCWYLPLKPSSLR